MRDRAFWRLAPGLVVVGLVGTHASLATAQTAPAASAPATAAPSPAPVAPAPAPPSAAPPSPPAAPPPPAGTYQTYPAYPPQPYPQGAYGAPPGYPPPPPGYAYAYPTAPRPPESVPYDGGAVPQGYHIEERARRGPVIAGVVVLSSAYALGLIAGSADNFPNSTGWLVVPVVGPWITLASRHQEQDCSFNSSGPISGSCVSSDDNNTTRTVLVLDGLTQATGAALLIYGLASPKKVLARDFVGRLEFTPAQMGKNGFGGFVMGTF